MINYRNNFYDADSPKFHVMIMDKIDSPFSCFWLVERFSCNERIILEVPISRIVLKLIVY